MEKKVKIDQPSHYITLNLDGEEITLTVEKAKLAQKHLNEIFGNSVPFLDWPNPVYPYPVMPLCPDYPNYPFTTWCQTTSTTKPK